MTLSDAVHLHQLPQRLEPVHFGHQHVENDEVGTLACADALERFLAAGDGLHVEPIHFEQRLKILPNTRFVVHDQNLFFVSHRAFLWSECSARSYSTSVGSRKEKELPRPTSLSTQTFPRCAWINRFVIAKPKPMPEDEGSTRTNSSKISW